MKFLLLFIACIVFTNGLNAQKTSVTVVIDPGHGGTDPGFLSENTKLLQEKELNLLIAKKFGSYIEENLQHVKVVYTRTDDSFPSLEDRVNKANSIQADYFISIHCNANAQKKVHGTESHVHSLQSKKSLALAKEVEKEFSTRAGRKSRGVKDSDDREHSLQVLKFTSMTSVLVECGFLTNEKEANYLNTTYGQEIIASAVYRAFRNTIVQEFTSIAFVKPEATASKPKKEGAEEPKKSPTEKYAIQIMSSIEPINTSAESFKKIGLPVSRTKLTTTAAYKYFYTVGSYTTKESAKLDLKTVQSNGFKDAYIVKIE